MNRKLLAIYLNDHLAGSKGALELLGRSQASNRGTEFGTFLDHLGREIDHDRQVLEDLMRGFGIRKSPFKGPAAWMAEKVSRLKLNGELRGYSPLSRLVELETLTTGVKGKLALWQSLQEVSDQPELAGFDPEPLIERARSQLSELEEHRRRAVRLALTEG